jgi:hypothetical protein
MWIASNASVLLCRYNTPSWFISNCGVQPVTTRQNIKTVFLKPLAIADHFIGGRRKRCPPTFRKISHTQKCMQKNNRHIIPVVKVTITIFYINLFKVFYKIMIKYKKLWKELIRILSAEGQPKKAVLAQTCMGVFFICSVSDTILQCFFFRFRLRTTV